uniref:Endonuclease/exonuclease/phosphatase domain-containing protein n=1 Tax=Populus alba TaxID=43335 RepID=A0A4U5P4U2_POPAL|nr:hypothetical protein D5086_0000230960 [Populus alba]
MVSTLFLFEDPYGMTCGGGVLILLGWFLEDKHNGVPVTIYEVTDFRECCSDLGLADLNSTGCLYTWSNGHVWSKIDRVMVNTHWSTLQQQAQVHFDNPGAFSDHSPSSIQIGSRQPCRNRNFNFFNMWADHPHFLELIEQCWNTPVYGSYMFTLCRKLKLLKRPLKELNKLHYSHISQRVTRAEEELDSLQSLLHQDCDNIHLQSQVKHLRSQLVHLKSAEQSYYGQKLKFTFLKEADKGTRFFHALLSQKHRRNHIPAIQVPSGTYSSSVDEAMTGLAGSNLFCMDGLVYVFSAASECCCSCFSLSSCGPSLLLLGSFFCWIYGVLVAFASALAGIEVQIQVDDAGIAGRQFSLGVLKLVTCMALIG